MTKKIIGYALKPIYEKPSDSGMITTAALIKCLATGEIIDTHGGGGEYLSARFVEELRGQETIRLFFATLVAKLQQNLIQIPAHVSQPRGDDLMWHLKFAEGVDVFVSYSSETGLACRTVSSENVDSLNFDPWAVEATYFFDPISAVWHVAKSISKEENFV